MKEDSVQHTEHGGVCAHTKRERDHHDRGEAGPAPNSADRPFEIVDEFRDPLGATELAVGTAILCLAIAPRICEISKLPLRLSACVVAIHSGRDQLLCPHV